MMVHGLPTLMRQNEAASKTHTQGPWRAGNGACVVADFPVPEIGGSDADDYYGGHLICESIAPRNIPIVAASPELLAQLKELVELIQLLDSTAEVRAKVCKAQELIRRIEKGQ